MSSQEPTRTIWTKSLFEGLYMALERKDPRAVKAAIDDLRGKDFPLEEILRHVGEDQGKDAQALLRQLLKPPAADSSDGLVGRLKKLFS